MSGKKVGLALGGGVARGMAHIGVLEVLQQEGIPIAFIAGTSIGAAIGAVYAGTSDAGQLRRWITRQSRRQLAAFIDLSLPKTGFIKGDKLRELLASFLGGEPSFGEMKIPFACVAADIDTGEEIVIKKGSVIDAVRASISLPGIFTLTEDEGRFLVDGGLVNPVPVNVVRDMGADLTIAINVIPDAKALSERERSKEHPGLIHIIMQSIYIGNYSLVRSSLEEADVVIQPQVAHVGAGDFHLAAECIHQGTLATKVALPEIKRLLGTVG
ncbi:patatin-like phospholipase family protein [Chloroflexota bacterium]